MADKNQRVVAVATVSLAVLQQAFEVAPAAYIQCQVRGVRQAFVAMAFAGRAWPDRWAVVRLVAMEE